MGAQLQIPLFPPDMMEKIKAAHQQLEIEKLRKELSHERHVKAGYIGAFKKLKHERETTDQTGSDSSASGSDQSN